MIKSEEFERHIATKCPVCGEYLLNPGYGRNMVICCGKYRRFFDIVDIRVIYDDGRDEKGRFHHKPKVLAREETVVDKGGN